MLRTIEQFLRRGMTAALFCGLVTIALLLTGPLVGAQQAPASTAAKAAAPQKPDGKAFSSPEQAAEALHDAAKTNNESQLMAIFGPRSKEMVIWGDNARTRQQERADFARKYEDLHRLVDEPDGTMGLYVGAENWPVPVPLVRFNGSWYFDADSGKQEVTFRRIGRNELEALEVCHALVEAEKDYYAGAHSYALKFTSASGKRDGLYWTGSGARSPIGPYLAHAGLDGSGNPVPFHGYYYRILSAQGGGFAILAFPAEYRSSGVMTFLMDQNGNASEKDLGPMTDTLARQVSAVAPDSTWKKSE